MGNGSYLFFIRATSPDHQYLMDCVSRILTNDEETGVYVKPGSIKLHTLFANVSDSEIVPFTVEITLERQNETSDAETRKFLKEWVEKRFEDNPCEGVEHVEALRALN